MNKIHEERLAKFKFWLYELDERELVDSREKILEFVTTLTTEHAREVEELKESVWGVLAHKSFMHGEEIVVKCDDVSQALTPTKTDKQ